jgi:hypothetical protein
MEVSFTINLKPIGIGWECGEHNNEYFRRYIIEFDSPVDFYRGDKLYCSKFGGDFYEYELYYDTDDGFYRSMCKREWWEPFQFEKSLFLQRLLLKIYIKEDKLNLDLNWNSNLELTCERKIYYS